jgi:4-amino-4-deoxy-L-arabinose transferase-like glycosyltransferase
VRRLRSVPPPLAVVLALAGLLAVAWSLLLPPLQGPDEVGHVAYVQRIADAHELPFDPGRGGGGRGIDTASTELRAAARAAQLEELQGNPAARPAWSGVDEAAWEREERRLGPGAREDGGFNASFRNPPLYYAAVTPVWLATSKASVFDRMWAVRLANVPLALALVVLVWLLAGELLGPALWPRTLAAGLAALQPGVTNLEGAINPDLLLIVLGTAALLAMLRLVRVGPSPARLAGLAAALAAAGLTNGRGLLLVAPAVVALLVAWRRFGAPAPRLWRAVCGATAAATAVLYAVALLRPVGSRFVEATPGGFAAYVWQFYLPRLPGTDEAVGPPGYGVREAFVGRLWGGYAQLEIELPSWAVTALLLASLALLGLLAGALWQRRARLDHAILAVCAAAVVALVAGLHLIAYRSLVAAPGDPLITGRYLLVLVGLGAVGAVAALRALPRAWRRVAGAVLLGAAVVLQVNAMGLLIQRFWT